MPSATVVYMLLLVVAALAAGYLLGRRRGAAGQHTIERQHRELQALARRVITLQEDERRTLSRELHDDIGQDITAIKLSSQMLLNDEDAARRAETIADIGTIADQTVVKLRNISLLLRPPQLDELGLVPALRWQAESLLRKGGPALDLDLQPLAERPPPAAEVACFRIAQEALTNALRHASAQRIGIRLSSANGMLELEVSDNGRGLPPGHRSGLGLVTMRERARQLGGELAVTAADEGGTRVCARLPMRPGRDGETTGRVPAG